MLSTESTSSLLRPALCQLKTQSTHGLQQLNQDAVVETGLCTDWAQQSEFTLLCQQEARFVQFIFLRPDQEPVMSPSWANGSNPGSLLSPPRVVRLVWLVWLDGWLEGVMGNDPLKNPVL